MHRLPRKLLLPALVALTALLQPLGLLAAGDDSASFTVDVKLGDTPLDLLRVQVNCFQGDDRVLSARIPPGETRSFSIPVPEGGELDCLVGAPPIPGQSFQFRGDGGSAVQLSDQGCLFTGVRRGHANFCQIEIEQERTGLTVYKKWIGSADREPDVEVRLDCVGESPGEPRRINQDKPAGWELQILDPDGLECSVRETPREDFRADAADCQNLIIRPGAQEECTLVNTKVVKMIQMLNRYGLVIMIAVFLVVGMFAARRALP
jgi:hypothetical protein